MGTGGFNSRPSRDGRRVCGRVRDCRVVSIHARRATGDIVATSVAFEGEFQFTPVARRATRSRQMHDRWNGFQFTPVARRATRQGGRLPHRRDVSIHARRATGDGARLISGRTVAVSIHARRATGDVSSAVPPVARVFQFTPVARRATFIAMMCKLDCRFQFTPVARRATSL